MTAVCVISMPDIWSVLALGVGGALQGIVFPISWWPALQIICCQPHYFITGWGIWDEPVPVFHFIASLLCSGQRLAEKLKKFVFDSSCSDWLTAGYVRTSLKCHCCMMYHTRNIINNASVKMSQAFHAVSHYFISFLLFIYLFIYSNIVSGSIDFLLSDHGQNHL